MLSLCRKHDGPPSSLAPGGAGPSFKVYGRHCSRKEAGPDVAPLTLAAQAFLSKLSKPRHSCCSALLSRGRRLRRSRLTSNRARAAA
jgi:hypothetical protein